MGTTLDLQPAHLEIKAQQSSRAFAQFTVDADLTGYLIRAKVRKWATDETVLLDISTATSGIVIVSTGATSVFNIDVPASGPAPSMDAQLIPDGSWEWDMQLIPPDGSGGHDEAKAVTWFSGPFDVAPEVTR